MQVDVATGVLQGADFRQSPNCDARPAGAMPELIVVHGISLPPGVFGGDWVEQLFTNRLDPYCDERVRDLDGVRVSSHLFVRRHGGVVQFVGFNERAWHAGVSTFKDRSGCNDFSIGIELEGTDTDPFTPVQYDRLEQIIIALRSAYPSIGDDGIVGHCHIAPGRKSDPGPAFDWARLQRNLGVCQPVTHSRGLNL